MDLATVLGMATVWGLVVIGILLGSSLLIFIDPPSIVIVLGGTVAVLFIAFPGGSVVRGLKAVRNAFFTSPPDMQASITLLAELSARARRDGLLSLEQAAEQTDDQFLARGLRMMADGQDPSAIESVLYDEIGKIDERHKQSIAIFEGIGDYAPGMGLIGTLIGLVQMLQSMDDPASIGPAMAVALLTTFYGALLANLIGIPLANKLKKRNDEELAHKELVAAGMLAILSGENPRFMVERLNATLAPADRINEAA
jgi:chemotaxis protein MotA